MVEGLSGRLTDCRYCDSLHLMHVAMAITFLVFDGYNFGWVIASDMLFDSRDGFSGSSYPMKT